MRAARLIRMVLLLQSRPSMTAAELARELEVSERTVTRDAQALSEAGVPVYAERGRTGGYRLVGGYRTRLTGLARGEAEALFLSGVPGALRDMGLEDAASAARLKVSAALLPSLRDAPRTAAQRFHLDAPGWFREPRTPPLLPAVAEAVWDDRRIAARYRRGDREVVRELEPYGLVLKAGVWYLCARAAEGGAPGAAGPAGGAPGAAGPAGGGQDAGVPPDGGADDRGAFGGGASGGGAPGGGPEDRGAAAGRAPGTGAPGGGGGGGGFRVYRIDRFTAVGPGGEDGGAGGGAGGGGRFARDEGFDLPAFWAERAAGFARSLLRTRIVVRLSPQGVRALPHAVDAPAAREALEGAGPPDAAGWVTVTLPVESEEVAHAQVRGLGPEAEVLEPGPLRERLARDARRIADLYGGERGGSPARPRGGG
ncbi:WYL domain-containing protein [Streptomyces sp. NPDC052077]|uniref:helix-turn-helix transcriptional regulator n=1 Tax=Streptomyces sp. NPDC052077 TaxID=3154757 RepID=UPI00342B05C1